MSEKTAEMYSFASLNEDQQKAYQLLNETNENYYVTGKAGTGKSYLLRSFVGNTSKNVAIVAPTGIAALNVSGQTIHSFFGLSPTIQDPTDAVSVNKGLSDNKISILRNLDTLIIDEVSMVRVDVMDMIDAKLKAARKSDEPFGGCQIIAFGDLYQLPPVVTTDVEKTFFNEKYGTIFFFGIGAARTKPFKIIELGTVLRQKDEIFINILNNIREGRYNQDLLNSLNTRYMKTVPDLQCLTLVPTNNAANILNHKKLDEIAAEPVFYHGFVEGDFDKDDLPVATLLELKPGAQVMMLTNKSPDWVNGTIGIIDSLTSNTVTVRTKRGLFKVDKYTWTKYRYEYNKEKNTIEKVEAGYYTQFPLKLSYAITIHKSQGQTYDSVIIDYTNQGAFAPGQTYVALSRCKNFDQLYLASPIKPQDIIVNQEVLDFMAGDFEIKAAAKKHLEVPELPEKETIVERLSDGRLKADDQRAHKKIGGRRFTAIFNQNKWMTPFMAWCEMMHVYEAPYKETKYTISGSVIEGIQYEYVKSKLKKDLNLHVVSPTDRYGENYKENTHYDFFRTEEIFGGMWDFLLADEDEKIVGVFEMKTTNVRQKPYYTRHYPVDYLLQAGLYAYLLGVKQYYMVTSYVTDQDYDHPEDFVCNDDNTTIKAYSLSEAFEKDYIVKTLDWYSKHILTGVSPVPDPQKDALTMDEISRIYNFPVTEEDKPDDQAEDRYYDNKYQPLEERPYNPDDYLHLRYI